MSPRIGVAEQHREYVHARNSVDLATMGPEARPDPPHFDELVTGARPLH
jgi:hypothetical protein